MNGHDYSQLSKRGARVAFSGPVRLRAGAPRTIGGISYRPGQDYAPDDPGVLSAPLFFVLSTAGPIQPTASPAPETSDEPEKESPPDHQSPK